MTRPRVAALLMLLGSLMVASADPTGLDEGGRDLTRELQQMLQQQNAVLSNTKCVHTDFGCELHPDFITTLEGTPSTESQKLMARTSALSAKCASYRNSTACQANKKDACMWAGNACLLSNAHMKLEWYLDQVSCRGSPAEAVSRCARLDQTDCSANSNCVWNPANLTVLLRNVALFMNGWMGGLSGVSLCFPKWVQNSTVSDNIATKITKTASEAAKTDGVGASSNDLVSVINDLSGSCGAISPFMILVYTCVATGNAANRTACASTPGCEWAGTFCDLADDFPVSMLLDPMDPWVSTLWTAKRECLPLNEAACKGSAPININTTRYKNFVKQRPQFNGATLDEETGAAALNSPGAGVMLLSGVVSLVVRSLLARMS